MPGTDDFDARFERQLVRHCSPTLAGLKSGNLFNLFIHNEKDRRQHSESIAAWNRRLNSKDIYLAVLRADGPRALVYAYRRRMLIEDLGREDTAQFLLQYGYPQSDVEGAIEHLRSRIEGASPFPHEIGLFLGYPLHDVKGFIDNGGRACIHSGCWKVYSNKDQAQERFEMFRKCQSEYLDVFDSGTPVELLAVAPQRGRPGPFKIGMRPDREPLSRSGEAPDSCVPSHMQWGMPVQYS